MGFFERLKDATIGFSGYARLGRSRWAFGFMTLILLLSMVVGVARWTKDAREIGPSIAQELEQGPDWGLADGEFHYDGPMPAFPASNFVIDTTGQYQPEQLKVHRQGVLLTKDRYYLWNNGLLESGSYSEHELEFTRADLSGLLGGVHRFVPYLGMLAFLLQLAFKALDAVILATIGTWMMRASNRTVPFDLAYRVALYAMTLPIIIQWIFNLSSVGLGFIIWWGVALLYTVGGLRSCTNDADRVPE